MKRAALTLTFLLVCGCACSFGSRVKLPDGAVLLTSEQAARQLTVIQTADREVQSLRGLSRTQLTIDGERSLLRHAVAFRRPDRLRLETLPTTSTVPLSLLIARGRSTVYLDPFEKTAYHGDWNGGLSRRVFGARLDEAELMAYIVGRAPEALLRGNQVKVYRSPPGNDLIVSDRAGRRVWHFDSARGLLKEAKLLSRGGALQMHWIYGAYRAVDGVLVPGRILLVVPGQDISFDFKFSSLSVNGDCPEQLFEVAIPEDYEQH